MTSEEKLNGIVRKVTGSEEFKYLNELTPIFDEIEKLKNVEQAELLEEILCYYMTNSPIKTRNKQIESGISRITFAKAREIIYRKKK